MQRTRVGTVEITALVDAHFVMAASYVFPEVEATSFEAYADMLNGDGAIEMICGAAVIQGNGRTVLVDTGNGPDGALFGELQAAAVSPSEVDIVVFTHLHGDHTGWNIDRESGRALFPNARYWVPRADWEHYGAEGGDNWEAMLAPLERLEIVDLFDGETGITSSLKLVPTPGHTPGHSSIEIRSEGEHAFVLGDAVVDPLNLNEPTWANVFDSDDETAIETRHEVISRLSASGELVVASHLGTQGLGRFVRDGDRLRFEDLP